MRTAGLATSRMLLFVPALAFCLLPLSARAPQTARDLDGKTVDPIKASRGKIAVLIFVSTDCPISNRYAPLLQHMNEAYSTKTKFWLVYPDKRATAQEIANHLKQFHYSISPLRDPDHSLVKLAKAATTPEAAVFDAQGRLLYHGRIDNWYESPARSRTAATTHELHDVLEAATNGKPTPLTSAPAVGCYISDLE